MHNNIKINGNATNNPCPPFWNILLPRLNVILNFSHSHFKNEDIVNKRVHKNGDVCCWFLYYSISIVCNK